MVRWQMSQLRGLNMNNTFNPGEVIRYTNCISEQVKWGNNDDPRDVLTMGELYTVAKVEVRSSHTKLSLEGIKDLSFNSVHFELKQ